MSVTRTTYDAMARAETTAVDDAYAACRKALQARGLKVANDDRAERLVEAIAVYVRESQRLTPYR